MGRYYSDNGYKLNLTFERGHALLNCVDMGKKDSVKWVRVQATLDLVLMDQMIKSRRDDSIDDLEVIHYDDIDDLADAFFDAIHFEKGYQVTDNSPMCYGKGANI